MKPLPMNMSLLRRDIHAEGLDCLCILQESDEDILTDDYFELRKINYHLAPLTKEWLESRILWAPSITAKDKSFYANDIASLLMKTDPNMLITLNRIIITSDSEADMEAIAERMADIMDEPDLGEMPDLEGFLGFFWCYTNSLVVNVAQIQRSVKEEAAAAHESGFYLDEGTEALVCFRTTLLHELRHLGLANPFLPESDYPDSENEETAVEQWAMEEYERICYIDN